MAFSVLIREKETLGRYTDALDFNNVWDMVFHLEKEKCMVFWDVVFHVEEGTHMTL